VFIAAGTLACAVVIVVITVRHGILEPSYTTADILLSFKKKKL